MGYAAPPASPFRRPPKNLQLTIDDGPEPVAGALTPILREIARRKVVAAFFVIGQEVEGRHSAIADIRASGHVIGNHSWDHMEAGTSTLSDAAVHDQFARTHAEVRRAGYEMQHWRAPRQEQFERLNGLISSVQAKPGARPIYTLTHCEWNADSRDSASDGSGKTAAQIIANIEADFRRDPRRVNWRLLFHVVPHTATALETVLDHFVADGHRLIDFTQSA